MASWQEYAGAADVLRPYGELDVLLYYGAIAREVEGFLRGRELATRTPLPQGRIRAMTKRGSREPPLYAGQLAKAVTPELMKARERFAHLEEARHVLSPDQALAWSYFAPRKLVELFYATNREGVGREISRVVYDVSPGRGVAATDALEVAAALAQALAEDARARDWALGDPLVSWAGGPFQVTVVVRGLQPASFYRQQIEYTGRGRTVTDRLVGRLKDRLNVPVAGGRFRLPGHVAVDPSSTPSGSLCRVPLGSLVVESAMTLQAVTVPLRKEQLRLDEAGDVVADLQTYGPGRVIRELEELAKRLPG